MPKSKFRHITDERMYEVMLHTMHVRGITQAEWCERVGFQQGNLSAVRAGRYSFQPNHMEAAMKLLGDGNFNFLFGVENNITRSIKRKPALKLLQEAVLAAKLELKK